MLALAADDHAITGMGEYDKIKLSVATLELLYGNLQVGKGVFARGQPSP